MGDWSRYEIEIAVSLYGQFKAPGWEVLTEAERLPYLRRAREILARSTRKESNRG
jgi:hypothetical protein